MSEDLKRSLRQEKAFFDEVAEEQKRYGELATSDKGHSRLGAKQDKAAPASSKASPAPLMHETDNERDAGAKTPLAETPDEDRFGELPVIQPTPRAG